MKKIVFACLLMPMCALASEPAVYVGGQYNFMEVDGGPSVDIGALSGRLGYEFNRNVAVEARLGMGVSDDTLMGVDIELNYYYGVYLRGQMPMDSGFTPYVIAGYTKGELEASNDFDKAKEDENDFSYGIGVDFAATDNLDVGLEYMMYLDKKDVEVSGFSLGVTYRF
ncbi:porin family protein [Ferrimonas kyonanensis]|uniref:porin family protein n=1 Tax=Ferrimonas kyonanensis TaxID=364763 RepID=UPI000423B30E|nr:porin family protein [Ferrimonas kyonanensis]